VLWSWAFCVKISPELGLVSSSTAMMLPSVALGGACRTCELDATTVPAPLGGAAFNSVSVAIAAAQTNITCFSRICRRRASAGLVLCPIVVMRHIYGLVVSGG
jgi:hypothetical protein